MVPSASAPIKEKGGIIFVQEPSEADFPMMPRSAIASGVADFIAPAAELAQRIVEVSQAKGVIQSLTEENAETMVRRITAFIHSRLGHDFSSYKRDTVLRRIGRRMQVVRSHSLADYADYLLANPEEAQELFGDLLISVTSFFRDPEAFARLESEVLPGLFDKPEPEGLRIWVAGCATGEEVYSLAILLLEEAHRRRVHLPIQIFATDLDEGALGTAREGRYPKSIEADVSDERLHRFFAPEGLHYRIRKEVREIVLFANHSIIKEPPFLRLDLISCRNLLIYLERDLQREVCATFAYGLKPRRFLFLGSAETTDAAPDLFTPVDREARIYATRPQASRRLPSLSRIEPTRRAEVSVAAPSGPGGAAAIGAIHLQAQDRAGPPGVLVDDAMRVLHLSGRAGEFLRHPTGPLSSELVELVRPELKFDLRTALRRAFDHGESTLCPATHDDPERPAAACGDSCRADPPRRRGRADAGAGQLLRGRRRRGRRRGGRRRPGFGRGPDPAGGTESGREPADRVAVGIRDRAAGSAHRQRGDAVDQRGIPLDRRGAGDLEGRAAVDERRAADGERRAEAEAETRSARRSRTWKTW